MDPTLFKISRPAVQFEELFQKAGGNVATAGLHKPSLVLLSFCDWIPERNRHFSCRRRGHFTYHLAYKFLG